MSNKEKILNYLKRIYPNSATNTDIRKVTLVQPHQQVFQLTSLLVSEGKTTGLRNGHEWNFTYNVERNMSKIVLLSCVKSKRSQRSKASELYTSTLFTKAFAYAKSLNPDEIFILSAEHGVLELDDEIEPYEKTLNNMNISARREWANMVLEQLKTKTDINNDEFVFLAGNNYRSFLVPHIKHYSVPMEGLQIGKQLQWLKECINE